MRGATSHRGVLNALALVLILVEPLGFSWYAASIFSRIADRGATAVALLVVRLLVAAFGIGAGLALWHRRPAGLPLVRGALVLAGAAVLVTRLSHLFPRNAPPGAEALTFLALLVWYGGWAAIAFRARQP